MQSLLQEPEIKKNSNFLTESAFLVCLLLHIFYVFG